MESDAKKLIANARAWLTHKVFPLWLSRGIDSGNGSFAESLEPSGEPSNIPRRSMVQARQIYSVAEAAQLGILPRTQAQEIVLRAANFYVANFSLPSGGFVHSLNPDGTIAGEQADLYSQAFALFGLAYAYKLTGDKSFKQRAKLVLQYLKKERAFKFGGYSETAQGQPTCASNPHMHLFEAAIAWMRTDADKEWKDFASELLQLCHERFIDKDRRALCEHFALEWSPQLATEGFVWEPGHHYEWAWLMTQFAEASGSSTSPAAEMLYNSAEEHGLHPQYEFAIDEVWSSGKIKKQSSRFWPHCERIKAAVSLGALAPAGERGRYALAADTAMNHLFAYFEGVTPGMWADTRLEDGKMKVQPAKGSSLYHIINAISQYEAKRPSL